MSARVPDVSHEFSNTHTDTPSYRQLICIKCNNKTFKCVVRTETHFNYDQKEVLSMCTEGKFIHKSRSFRSYQLICLKRFDYKVHPVVALVYLHIRTYLFVCISSLWLRCNNICSHFVIALLLEVICIPSCIQYFNEFNSLCDMRYLMRNDW